jgi:hypothetical protein
MGEGFSETKDMGDPGDALHLSGGPYLIVAYPLWAPRLDAAQRVCLSARVRRDA